MNESTPQVAINGRAAARLQVGGVERLAREMAARLPGLNPGRYRLIQPDRRLAHRAGHLWEQAALPALAAGCELIYSPANLAPVLSRRSILVIHDLAALRHPEAYSGTYANYHRLLLPVLAHRARRLITVSQFSKRELADGLDISPDRIDVVPLGVDERFSPQADAGPAARRHGLRRPYVLMVGTPSERKNLTLLQPVQSELAKHGAELVLAGSSRRYLRAGPVAARRLGYVDEADLPGLYTGAAAVVMPSRYEGFGLPCLEAMASGTPVVAARCAALPETCGDSALLVDPGDEDSFAAAVMAAAFDLQTRSRLIEAGRARAAGYTWDETARMTDASITVALDGLRRDAGRRTRGPRRPARGRRR